MMRSSYRRPRLARRLKRAVTALALTALVAASFAVSTLVIGSSHDAAVAANPTVSCTTTPNLFNTGYNSATAGKLASGTDPNWTVAGPYGTNVPGTAVTWANVASKTGWGIQTPPVSATWGAANVGSAAPGAWYVSPFSNAEWISQESGGSNQAGPGTSWYYKYDFTMSAQLDPSTYVLNLDFFADNSVAEVYVNGVAQSTWNSTLPQGGPTADPTRYQGYTSGNRSSVVLAHGWQTGSNSIVVQVYSAPGVEGFLAQASSPAACAYTVQKSVDKTNTTVGDTVTYTVTVTNVGSVSLPFSGMAAGFTDDISDVVDDATYNNDAAGGGTFSYDGTSKVLSWDGPVAGGASAVLTYSVTVKAGGNGSLINQVSPTDSTIGSCAGACTATSIVDNTVDAVNDGPLPVSVGATLNTNVRANDTSATGVSLAAPALVSSRSVHNNAVSVRPNGTIDYVAAAGFSGADSYTYTLCDTGTPTPVCDATPATVSVVVNNVFSNGPATTGSTTPQNTPKTFALSTLATVTGSALAPGGVSQLAAPSHGALVINPDGSVVYTPTGGFSGPDSFQLTVCDQSAPTQCTVITVSLTVGVNSVTANPDAQTVLAGGSVTTNVVAGDASGGVADTTVSGTALNPAISLVTPPAHGVATVHGDGTITYLPDAGFSGADAYSYSVCDTSTPTPTCATGAVTVTVNNGFITPDGPGTPGVPDGAGGGGAASGVTPQNTDQAFALSDLITVKGQPIDPATIAQVGTAPHGGALVIDTTTGGVVYTPAAGYTGPDSFVLAMCDTASPVSCYSVTTMMTVGPNIVLATDDSMAVPYDQSLDIPVMDNDITRTGQPLDPGSVVIITPPANGTVTLPTFSALGSTRLGSSGASAAGGPAAWGSVIYTPRPGFTGRDTFSYRVCDTSTPSAVCATALVTITVDGPTLAFTGAQGTGILLLGGFGALIAGIALLVAPRRRGGRGTHRAA